MSNTGPSCIFLGHEELATNYFLETVKITLPKLISSCVSVHLNTTKSWNKFKMHLHWTNIFSAFSLNKMWRGIYFWSIYIGVHHMVKQLSIVKRNIHYKKILKWKHLETCDTKSSIITIKDVPESFNKSWKV